MVKIEKISFEKVKNDNVLGKRLVLFIVLAYTKKAFGKEEREYMYVCVIEIVNII